MYSSQTAAYSEHASSPLTGSISQYNFLARLAEGSSGEVEVWDCMLTRKKVAIKFIPRKSVAFIANWPYVKREVMLLSKLKHPHIVGFREVFLSDNDLALVMTFVPGGTLSDYLMSRPTKSLSEAKARWLFQQLILIREFCARKKICHRDIKPKNLLMGNNERLILADFGLGKESTLSEVKTTLGTRLYAAPEILKGTMATYNGDASDVWSCGVVLLEMLFGFDSIASFYNDNVTRNNSHQDAAQFNNYPFYQTLPALGLSPSALCQDLIRCMLTEHPDQRITIDGIMAHPWFLRGLPPESLQMNDKYMAMFSPQQSAEVWLSTPCITSFKMSTL